MTAPISGGTSAPQESSGSTAGPSASTPSNASGSSDKSGTAKNSGDPSNWQEAAIQTFLPTLMGNQLRMNSQICNPVKDALDEAKQE